ncbi:hypothetical protein Pcinc_023349 [Petrolisthes cinctipes]|uniref:Tectonic domain-containing protein n=1 Tax=Petrolisthes cinctipes TaxID=88211 RepID=A0AAE1KFE3_PETCI|nr:hypothetical protein Pcinc_023349 [Petrolisthes cinctipes]
MTFSVLLRPLLSQDTETDLEKGDTETTLATPFSGREESYPDYFWGNETGNINGTWNETDKINGTTDAPSDTSTLPPTTPVTDAPTTTPDSMTESDFLIDDFCICDLKVGSCDVNCCCDEDCTREDRMVFSHCSTRPQPVLDNRYCYQKHLAFSNNTEYHTEVVKEGLFCIITDNLPQRTTYTEAKGARSLEEYEKLNQDSKYFPWKTSHLPVPSFSETGYLAGGPVWGIDPAGNIFVIGVPSSVIGSGCEARESLRYLETTKSDCIWVQDSILDHCHATSHFSLPALVAFYVVADPSRLFQNASISTTEETATTVTSSTEASTTYSDIMTDTTSPDLPTSTPLFDLPEAELFEGNLKVVDILEHEDRFNNWQIPDDVNEMVLLPVKVYMCFNQDGEENCTETSFSDLPKPTYSREVCGNVVRHIHYIFTHNGTMGIVEARANVYLTNLTKDMVRFSQMFQSKFVWASAKEQMVLERSGRPGYIIGKPVILGTLVGNVTEDGEKREAISLNPDPRQWLTILSGGRLGNCGEARSQVKFGVEVRSGCVVEVTQTDLTHCSKLQQQFLDLLMGPILQEAETEMLRVATFGDSSIHNAGDWVPLLVPELPRFAAYSGQTSGGYKCSELTLSMHLEIAFTLQGALANPQAKIIAVVLRFGSPQTLEFICNSINCNIQCGSPDCHNIQGVELVSSVAFVDATQPSEPAYASPPTWEVKLPYDFFYPFLPAASSHLQGEVICIMAAYCTAWLLCY